MGRGPGPDCPSVPPVTSASEFPLSWGGGGPGASGPLGCPSRSAPPYQMPHRSMAASRQTCLVTMSLGEAKRCRPTPPPTKRQGGQPRTAILLLHPTSCSALPPLKSGQLISEDRTQLPPPSTSTSPRAWSPSPSSSTTGVPSPGGHGGFCCLGSPASQAGRRGENGVASLATPSHRLGPPRHSAAILAPLLPGFRVLRAGASRSLSPWDLDAGTCLL